MHFCCLLYASTHPSPSRFNLPSGKVYNNNYFLSKFGFFLEQSHSVFQDELGCKPAYSTGNQVLFMGLVQLRHVAGYSCSSAFAF